MVDFPHGGAASVFRDFKEDGNPVSDKYEPPKNDIRDLILTIQDAINALAAATGDPEAIADILAAFATKAEKAITVTAAGLAQGGGNLAANRTITVPKASPADVVTGSDDAKAVTSLGVKAGLDDRSEIVPTGFDDERRLIAGAPVADANYRALLHVSTLSNLIGLVVGGDVSIEVIDDGQDRICIVDGEYRAFSQMDSNGVTLYGGDAPDPASSGAVPGTIADVMHSNGHGQSLSVGTTPTGVAAYTTTALYSNIMFATGPRYTGVEALTAFAALVEKVQSTLGETGIAVSLAHTVEMIAREDGYAAAAQGGVFLGSASGVGGYSITQLNKGTTPYTNLLALVTAAYGLCQTQGKSYAYTDTMWTQGETDQVNSVSRATHKGRVLTLFSDLKTDIKAISGQAFDPLMITYQPASHIWYKNRPTSPNGPFTPNIALALRDAALESDIRIACPMYFMEYVDEVHLPSNWYQVLGAYYGRLRKRLLDDRKAGRALGLHRLDVKSVAWQGKIIDVTLDVPEPPIVLDTTLVAGAVNYGFDLWDSGGSLVDTITNVAIAGPDRIRITCSATPPSGTVLTAGWGRPGDDAKSGRLYGPRCNIRDSEGVVDTITDGLGTVHPLHNWLVLFDATKP